MLSLSNIHSPKPRHLTETSSLSNGAAGEGETHVVAAEVVDGGLGKHGHLRWSA